MQLSKPSAEVIARWQKLLKQPDREAAVSLLPNAAVCVPLGVGEAAMGELWRLVGLLWRETVVVEPLQKWSEVLRLERVDVVLIDTRQERGHWFGESDLGALARRHPNARVIVYGPAPEGISESISPPVTVVEKGPTERLVARLADWLCVQTRTSIRVPVKLAGEVDGMAVQVIDLSVTGARIAMRKGFVPGSDVTLELVLDETKLQLSCLVRWCRDTPGQVQAGLSFEQVQAEALDVIGRYVDGKALLFRTVSAVRRKAEEPS